MFNKTIRIYIFIIFSIFVCMIEISHDKILKIIKKMISLDTHTDMSFQYWKLILNFIKNNFFFNKILIWNIITKIYNNDKLETDKNSFSLRHFRWEKNYLQIDQRICY